MPDRTRELRYWQAGLEALQQEMRRDSRVVLLGEDIAGAAGREKDGFVEGWGGPFGATRGLVHEFGRERVLDTPISEAAFLGAAVGLAENGFCPWVEVMFPSFFGVCLDQLLTNMSQKFHMFGRSQALPIVVKTLINHHGVLYSMIAHIPGIKVVAPSDPYTAKGLMLAAMRDPNPVVVFDNISLLRARGRVPECEYVVPIGEAAVVRPGADVTLVGISAMTRICLTAAQALEEQGIDAEVIDLRTIVPLDVVTLTKSVSKTGRLVVVDQDVPVCSVARDVVAVVAEQVFPALKSAPRTINAPNVWQPFSSALSERYAPSSDTVSEIAGKLVNE